MSVLLDVFLSVGIYCVSLSIIILSPSGDVEDDMKMSVLLDVSLSVGIHCVSLLNFSPSGDVEDEMTVSVLLDGEESTLEFHDFTENQVGNIFRCFFHHVYLSLLVPIHGGSSGGRVVKLLACGARGPGFDSRPRHLNFQRLVISCFQVEIWLKDR